METDWHSLFDAKSVPACQCTMTNVISSIFHFHRTQSLCQRLSIYHDTKKYPFWTALPIPCSTEYTILCDGIH